MILFKGNLTKLNPLKDVKANGEFIKLPEIGENFVIVKSFSQCFKTPKIKEIISDSEKEIVFKTLNSMYKLEYEIVEL